MNRSELAAFLRRQPWAVQASVDTRHAPQAAVIGIAVADDLTIVFDTLAGSRKHRNLTANDQIALVVGWDSAQTFQFNGAARQPKGAELEQAKQLYFARFPDGRDREKLPDIRYWSAEPYWIRFSDFTNDPPRIVSWEGEQLIRLRQSN